MFKDSQAVIHQIVIKSSGSLGLKHWSSSKDFIEYQVIWMKFIKILMSTTQGKT